MRTSLRVARRASTASSTATRALTTSTRSRVSSSRHKTHQQTQQQPQPSAAVLAAVGIAAVGGCACTDLVAAREPKVDVDAVKKAIVAICDEDSALGPTFVRLAWHASGTFDRRDGSGGSTGGTIRFEPELRHGANAGLDVALKALERVKRRHPAITYADLFVLAGITMIEEMGGPAVPFRLGRPDATSGAAARTQTPDGRLPSADTGSKESTTRHVRDVFARMGFDDRDLVALVGAHAVGRCYPTRSGYSGPWTRSEWTFSNSYFRELVENTWTVKTWDGPMQYEDPTGELMMLPSDMVLVQDPGFKQYVEMYAKDEDLWFRDFAKAFVKLTENGIDFPETSTWGQFVATCKEWFEPASS